MCEVKSKGKQPRTKKQKQKYSGHQQKEMNCDKPHLMPNEKNIAHPVDRTTNWCIGGCWFTLALVVEAQKDTFQLVGIMDLMGERTSLKWLG